MIKQFNSADIYRILKSTTTTTASGVMIKVPE